MRMQRHGFDVSATVMNYKYVFYFQFITMDMEKMKKYGPVYG